MNKAGKEMLLEGGRLVLFAAVGALVAYLLNVVLPSLPETQTTIVLALVLKMADKYVHKSDWDYKGISPF